MQDLVICGGGLGGLSAAAALAQKGMRSIVLEKASQFGEIGAGIQIGPNGFRALDMLGITPMLKTTCVFINDLKLMSAVSGDEISRIPLGPNFLKRFGFPYAVVHRAKLHQILLDLCKSSDLVDFRLNSEVQSYTQNYDCVELNLKDGRKITGQIAIGADGLRSKIRQQLVGDGEPIVSGKSTYRSIINVDQMPDTLRWNSGVLWAGPKVHAVHYPISGGKMFNLVANCEDGIECAVNGAPIAAEDVQDCFVGMAPVLQNLIGLGTDWKHWVLCDREPIKVWVDHRVALLGDAAHPMLQYFAQGACMAFEDSMILAQSLDEFRDDLSLGLDHYQKRRHARTASVQKQSRSVGTYICHASGRMAAYRDRTLSARDPERWFDILEWIYGSKESGLG